MKNNKKPQILAESKRPGTTYTRSTTPTASQQPGNANKPNPNYIPPASVKKANSEE